MCWNFTYMSVHHMHALPTEARRGWEILWNFSYRQLWATLQDLSLDLEFAGRAASAVTHWAITWALWKTFLPTEPCWWPQSPVPSPMNLHLKCQREEGHGYFGVMLGKTQRACVSQHVPALEHRLLITWRYHLWHRAFGCCLRSEADGGVKSWGRKTCWLSLHRGNKA